MSYPTTFGITNGGVVHIADATYPNTADTRCGGVGVPMDKFYHHQDGIGALPPGGLMSRCAGCFAQPAPAASGDGEELRLLRELEAACRRHYHGTAPVNDAVNVLRRLDAARGGRT